MASENFLPIDIDKAKSVLDQLMKTSEGRTLVDRIRNQFKALNDKLSQLSSVERKKFTDEFREQFAKSFDGLKQTADSQNEEDNFSESDPNSHLFIVIFLVLLAGFFGYKLYKSIMEKEQKVKKSKKDTKKEKKVNSPPSSPRSKKD